MSFFTFLFRDRLRDFIHQSPDPIVVLKAVRKASRVTDFTWTCVNPAFEKLLGRRSADLLGKWHNQEYPGAIEAVFPWYCEVLETNVAQVHEIHYTGEGLDLWLILSITALGRDEIILVNRDISAMKEQSQRDALTKLLNRHAFGAIADTRQAHGVLYLDLDRFKLINDSSGHETGDRILIEVARRLERVMRQADRIYRDGGDEFLVVLNGEIGERDATAIAWRLIAALETPIVIGDRRFSLSATVGVALQPGGLTVSELRSQADMLVSLRKRSRKLPRVVTASLEALAMGKRRLQIEEALSGAVDRQEFYLLFQPIVNLQVEGYPVVGFEALVRWQSPVMGIIGPQEFIPIAEESGQIQRISDWVLETACGQARRWRMQRRKLWQMHINCSAIDMTRPEFIRKVEAFSWQIGCKALTLELTETALTSYPEGLMSAMARVRSFGVMMAIDDFGAGYNNLLNLIKLPIDIVKIDKEFISGVHASESLCKNIILLCNDSKRITVAEGVETQEQAQMLRGLGCSYGQGWFFGKPMTSEEVMAIVAAD